MRTVAIVLAIVTASLALGDGRMFGEKLTEAPPSIQSQRAVLKFDGQEETMIVESVLSGPPGKYGWVVPLPNKPSFVKAVKPEYVRGTFSSVVPQVKPLRTTSLPFLFTASILLLALTLTCGMRYRKLELGWRIMVFFGEIVGLLAVAAVIYPMFNHHDFEEAGAATAGAAASMPKAKMEVEDLGVIGSYQVSVLSGEDGKPLLEWLRKHNIYLPDNALGTIEQYAKEGWCFLAAEFRKDEARPLPPHPLKAVFPSDKLIYPMRLTGTQEEPLRLELVVVSNKRAEAKGMRVWSCKNDPVYVAVNRDPRLDKDIYSEWDGSLYAMAKQGAVVTYLRGNLGPEQMREDFSFDFEPYERFEVVVHDADQATAYALQLAALWMPLGGVVLGFLGVLFPRRAIHYMAAGAVAALISGSAGAGTWYGSVEKVDTTHTFLDLSNPESSRYPVPSTPPIWRH
ncbi:MAG TPA: DUF2330 domain-containing protein [Fimbriimonadaceae bacterium]|nr:DUF2330 domain-containing protein [Fimbriimonadaceae bacterium]